jgi:dihydrofolate reductase
MKTSVSCGVSVDGFLARPSGALDFLDAAGSEPHGCDEFIATVDTIVMGRNTFEIVMGWSARSSACSACSCSARRSTS